jgi:hypothetical protein
VTIERGLMVGGRIVPRTELVQRHGDAWWSWDSPTDRPDLRRRPRGDVTALVGHWTGGPVREALAAPVATVQAMRARERPDGSPMSVSCHLVIGWDGQVWQVADLAHATIHAGSAINAYSVGVETTWPGSAEQARAIAAALRRRGRQVQPAYERPAERRVARGHVVECVPPSPALLAGWVALAELLAALPASTGIVIPRQLALEPARRRRGALEHQHVERSTKVDAAGYLVAALTAAGWAP